VSACACTPRREACRAAQAKMGGRPADRAAMQPAMVTLDTFLTDFSVAKLMNKLADLEQHDLRAKIAAVSRPQLGQQAATQQQKPSAVTLTAELQLVDKLLVNFQR